MRPLITLAAVVLLGGASYLILRSTAPAEDLGLYRDTEAIAEGKVLYDMHCAACHGADLSGEPDWQVPDEDGLRPAPPHDETGHTWHHPDDLLFRITKLGSEAIVGGGYRSNMPGFGEVLIDDQIYTVLAYIKSTWPPHIIARHDQINAAAAVEN